MKNKLHILYWLPKLCACALVSLVLSYFQLAEVRAEEAGEAANEVKELKESIAGLKGELEGFKSQAQSMAASISNINAAANRLTNDLRVARPNRIPEDVRFLADLINNEKVVVKNGEVYRINRPFVNALSTAVMIGPVTCDKVKAVTIDQKLIQLQLAVNSSMDTNELNKLTRHQHVEELYKRSKVEDWQFHRLRYGVSTFYNDELGGIGAGVTLRGYPAYSRYIDGRFLDFDNGIWRRLSIQVSVGGMLTRDDAEADSTGLVGTLGVGWDIVYGISLFAGQSFYAYSKPGEDGTTTDDATVYGVTLNAEFWQTIFGSK
ncbi:MAG TPA: hypothetical protein PKC67_04750 [Kiritimatiellia bacterium]|nr:hypothetical protein [Kiritimatiellia bacterium]HMP33640.1 hypothetical protein [Kiritimatiellia bacterium]